MKHKAQSKCLWKTQMRGLKMAIKLVMDHEASFFSFLQDGETLFVSNTDKSTRDRQEVSRLRPCPTLLSTAVLNAVAKSHRG